MKYHYVYRITNIELNKYYYGCRTSKVAPVLDLCIKYFSSSTDINFKKDQKENPHNYKYKIVKIFNLRIDATLLEIKLHNKFNVGVNESFYNKVKQTAVGFDRTGTSPTPESIKLGIDTKIKNGNNRHTDEAKRKISIASKGRTPGNKGKPRSITTIEKATKSNTGKKRSDKQRKNISDAVKGKTKSKEHCDNISKSKQGVYDGDKNPSAKKINIYNNEDELMYECHGNFLSICELHDLPDMSLIRSYRNNGEKIYNTPSGKTRAKKLNKELYIGWYAEIIN